MKRKLLIIGAGGFGRDALAIAEAMARAGSDLEPLGFLDDDPTLHGQVQKGVPILGSLEDMANFAKLPEVWAVCAIGEPDVRRQIVSRLDSLGVKWATLIHPQAIVSDWVTVGEGTIIHAGAVATTSSCIGRHAIVNVLSAVAHDNELADFTTLSPMANLAGGVRIGVGAFIGASAVVREGRNVGDWAVVAMGAVVVTDVPPGLVVSGVPARPRRENRNRRVFA